MEITEIKILSEFEAGMKCLQNPSSLSRFFPISSTGKVPQPYIFWKWGAIILAIVATFSSLINQIKLLVFRVRTVKPLPPLQNLDEDFDWSSDDEDHTCSSASESDEEEYESTSSFEDEKPVEKEFIGGHRFSWSDFATGKSVVQLWDSFGLGLDFEDDSEISSCFETPAVVLSADVNESERILLSGYDNRIGCETPAIYADWRPRPRQRRGEAVVGNNCSRVEKVYVRNGFTGGVTVGDMRNVKAPLENYSW